MSDPREVLIFQHVSNEGGGTILPFLERRGIPCRTLALHEGAALPDDLERVRAVCVMGGPMNVYEETAHPFLAPETACIARLLRENVPVLGVCLGSQLIAKALGARVYRAEREEIGWMRVKLTDAAKTDPVFGGLGEQLEVLQWHGDTFDLPDGARLLAAGADVPHQAYRVGSAYALQFHVEVTRPMLENWFSGRDDLPAILAGHDRYAAELQRITDRMYAAFFGLSR